MRTFFCAVPLALALLAGCGGGDTLPPPATYAAKCGLPAAADEPYRTSAPTGPHCVGASEFLLTDATRDETLTEAPGDRRAVQVRVTYPAAAPRQAVRMPYAGEEVYTDERWWPAGLRAQGHAWRDVLLADTGPAPVILFAPGLESVAQAYTGLTEDLASRGYVVVTVNHPYISGPTPLPDGRIARNVLSPAQEEQEGDDGEEGDDVAERMLPVAVADMRFVLDWLAQRNAAPGGLLGGKLDLHRIAAYGHSFGGATALQWQRTDPRVKAAVNLDGTVRGDLREPWTKPWMILQSVHAIGGVPFVDHTMNAVWETRRGPAIMEVMPGSCHGDFSDIPGLVRRYVARTPGAASPLPAELFCAADPAALERDVRRKVADFFARYVP